MKVVIDTNVLLSGLMSPHPDDEPILATLVASKADVLVTGDAELLKLRDRYPIQTPAEFARRL